MPGEGEGNGPAMEVLEDQEPTWDPKDWKKWVAPKGCQQWPNMAVPAISNDEAKELSYADITAILKYITDDYKPDMEVFDDMGWRKHKIYKYKGQKYHRGPLQPITHEELRHWDRLELKHGFYEIAKYCADVITDPEDTQSVLGMSVGMSGSGKSMGTGNMLWGAGIRTADNLTKDPAKWRNYYQYWVNTKVIDKENFADMFKELGTQSIRFGDDAFNALNRTKFMTGFMEELNTIAATDRVFKDITWFSMQWAGQIDIIIRQLAGVRIDFKRAPMARKWPKNLNTCKFHILDYNQYNKRNPVYTRYVHTNNVDVEDHFVGTPPEEFREWYDLYRLLAAVVLKKKPKTSDNDEEVEELGAYECHRCGSGDKYTGKDHVIKCKPCGFRWRVDWDVNNQGGWTITYLEPGVPGEQTKHYNMGERYQFIKKK